ncbi:MAG TPA: hypothetical protein VFX33_14800 [Actinomycetales bacterium]|nr:hypothetical protein [Actinomycetales bacterium]
MAIHSMAVALAGRVLAGDVNPQGPDPTNISPGLVGFLATFGLVVAAIGLFFSMTRHLRKVDYARRREEAGNSAEAANTADAGPEERRADHGGGAEPDERAEESSLESPGVVDVDGELGGEERQDRPPGRA